MNTRGVRLQALHVAAGCAGAAPAEQIVIDSKGIWLVLVWSKNPEREGRRE